MAGVRLSGVSKLFGKVRALDSFSLDIADGEFMVFVGPSGCGKTTALRIIAGLEEASSGSITIGDRVVDDVPAKDRDIAMVFQSYALYPHMTVAQNMSFGLRIRMLKSFWWQITHRSEARRLRTQIDERVRETAQMLGIEDLLGRRPRELSGGQRQRVALGRAIVREPKVFLMDEPLSNLDAKLRVQTRAELIRLHRRLGITTIYVTHDQTEAMTMGDRIAVLRDGVLQQVASPDELYKKPANTFVASFIGSPPMNLLTLPVERGNASLGGASIPVPINSGKIVLGIRPEEFRTSAEGIELRPTVDVVEPLGATKSVMLTIDGNSLTASLDADVQVEEGKSISLWIRPNSIHYFDADSGNAIRQTSGDEAMTVSSQGSQ
ncbi:MAG TPA: sn-glycerol-3-phosphate ABC transporter ATP-binding protein UgpC [Fimbriimonadales bacterium]|jgi:multiple sugar transport system ATP-binding protein|nr:sn-glycerol-3-phosphate ABC transporter ATP-binding protein UgpC [Fimbriimonadales bacterium]